MKQLELRHPEPLSAVVTRVFAPYLRRAEQEAAALQAAGKTKRARELLDIRRRTLASMQRASECVEKGRRKR